MEPHQHTDGYKHDKCKEVFAMLSDYLNMELPPEACQEIEAHIAGCRPCVEFAESLRKTVDLCRHYQPQNFPRLWARKPRHSCWMRTKRCWRPEPATGQIRT